MASDQHLFPLHGISIPNRPFEGDYMATTLSDINSPEAFVQSLEMVKGQLKHLSELAKTTVKGIESAYEPSSNSSQIASQYGQLHSSLQTLYAFLRQTGVGDLVIQSEKDMDKVHVWNEVTATEAAQGSYARRLRIQENAAVISNLLMT